MENIAPINNSYPNATKLIPHGQKAVAESGGFASFLFGDNGLSFDDIIDTINPLHHIPVVSTLYQNITGDEIANAPALIGGAVTGGPLGLASAAINVASRETTDKSLGDHVLDFFIGDEGEKESTASTSLAGASQLAPDNGAAALALFQSGDLESSAIMAANSLSGRSTSSTAQNTSTPLSALSQATNQYNQKLSSMGISTQLADIKA